MDISSFVILIFGKISVAVYCLRDLIQIIIDKAIFRAIRRIEVGNIPSLISFKYNFPAIWLENTAHDSFSLIEEGKYISFPVF